MEHGIASLRGYQIQSVLFGTQAIGLAALRNVHTENRRSTVFRAVREADKSPVIIKLLRASRYVVKPAAG